jgi:hypothetical protein
MNNVVRVTGVEAADTSGGCLNRIIENRNMAGTVSGYCSQQYKKTKGS